MQTAKVKLILSYLQNEADCETFLVKMSFISMRLKNHFHINGYELSLALKQRLGETREKSFLS